MTTNAVGNDEYVGIDDIFVGAVGDLSINDVSHAEGNVTNTTYTFTVTRSGGSSGAVAVNWAISFPGGAGIADASDFTGSTSGTLNWADGDSASKTITVTVTGDLVYEPNETFTINLSGATGGASITDGAGAGGITNDDAPVAPAVDLDGGSGGIDYASGAYVEGDPEAAIGTNIAVTAGTFPITSATITITDAIAGDQLTISGTLPATIIVSSGAGTGTLVLTGTGSDADWANALGCVVYSSTSENPDTYGTDNARTISVTVTDGVAPSTAALATIAVAGMDDAPVLSGLDGTDALFTEGDFGIALTNVSHLVTVTDVDNQNFDGGFVQVGIMTGGTAADEFFLVTGLGDGVAGGGVGNAVLVDNVTIGTMTSGGPGQILTIDLNTNATAARVATLLDHIGFRNASQNPTEGTRQVTWLLNDGQGGAGTALSSVDVHAVNDAPMVTDLPGDVAGYIEQFGSVRLDAGTAALVSNDDANFGGGVLLVSITGNYQAGEDVLGFFPDGVVTISGNDVIVNGTTIGLLTAGGASLQVNFNSNASNALVGALLHSFTYNNTNTTTPNPATRTITWDLMDGGGTAGGGANETIFTSSVTVTPVNDAPVVTNLPGETVGYIEQFGSVRLDNGLDALVTATDQANFGGGQLLVQIVGALAEDRLEFFPGGAVTISGTDVIVSSTTIGTLVFATGDALQFSFNSNASAALVQTLIRTITYNNIGGDTPTEGTRTIFWDLQDGGGTDNGGQNETTFTSFVSVTAVNDEPVVTELASNFATYVEQAGSVALDQGVDALLTDDNATFAGGGLLVFITTNYRPGEDVLLIHQSGNVSIIGSTVLVDGFAIGTLTAAGGSLQVDFNAFATPARVQTLLRSIHYDNLAGDAPNIASRIIQWNLLDGGGTGNGGDNQLTFYSFLLVTAINDAPVVTGLAGDNALYTEGSSPVLLDAGVSALLTNDVDGNAIAGYFGGGLHVYISAGAEPEDVLGFNGTTVTVSGMFVLVNGITTGFLTRTSTDLTIQFGANATTALVETLLRGITYTNTAGDAPTAGTRTISWDLVDGGGTSSGGSNETTFTSAVTVSAVNDAPVVSIVPVAGAEVRINSFTAGNQFNPSIAGLSDGGYVVTWTSRNQDGDGSGVFAQRYDSSGVAQGSEVQVNSFTTTGQFSPSAASLSGGGYVIVWTSDSHDGSSTGIYAQRYGADGLAQGGEVRVNTTTGDEQSTPSVAALSGGGYVVTWDSFDQDGSGYGVYAQRYDANGTAQGVETRVNTTIADDQFDSCVAGLSGGGYVVTWTSANQDGSGFGVYAQLYDAGGTAQGGEVRVNTTIANEQMESCVTGLSGGGYVVVWTSVDGGFDIYAQLYDAAGAAQGGEMRVNATTANVQVEPSVAALADGGFVVTWTSVLQDGDAEGVFAQRYDANGIAQGEEVQVNSFAAGGQFLSAVGALSGGGYVVTWTSADQDGSGFGVYAQQYGFTATEQVALDLKGTISVGDADSGAGTITVTLSVDYGILTVDPGASGVDVADSGTATVTLTGTLAEISSLLGANAVGLVTFTANTDDPPASAALSVTIDDGGNSGDGGPLTDTATATIAINAVDDPLVLNVAANNVTFTEGDAPLTLDAGLTITDVDGPATIDHAAVVISGGYVSGEDTLTWDIAFAASHGITADLAEETLTFTGTASLADYETLLRSVAYLNTNGANPNIGDREITFGAGPGGGLSHALVSPINAPQQGSDHAVIVHVVATADFPTGTDHTIIATEDVAYAFTYADFGYFDPDGDAMAGVYVDAAALTGGTLYDDNVAITTDHYFISLADIIAGHLTYQGLLNANGAGLSSFGFQVLDMTGDVTGLDQILRTMTVDVTPVNDAPDAHPTLLIAGNLNGNAEFGIFDLGFSDVEGDTLASFDFVGFTSGVTFLWDHDGNPNTPLVTVPIPSHFTAGGNPVFFVHLANGVDDGGVFFTVTDSGGATSTMHAVQIHRAPPNAPPVVDNLASDEVAFNEGGGPVHLDFSLDSLVSDDGANFGGGFLLVSIDFALPEDVLGIDTGGIVHISGSDVLVGSITIGTLTLGSGSLQVDFNSNATAALVQALIQAITYDNSAGDDPSEGLVDISWTLNDGGGGDEELSFTSSVSVYAVNDAPVNTVPAGPIAVTEDTAQAITGLAVADADIGVGVITVTLSVLHGTLWVRDDVPGGLSFFEIWGNGTGTVILQCDPDDVNATLAAVNGLVYTPDANYNGSDTLTMTSNDNGFSGADPGVGCPCSEEDTDTVTLTISAVNDAPVPFNYDTVVAASGTGPIDLRIAVPIDPEGDPVTVTLTGVPSYGVVEYFNGTSWIVATGGETLSTAEITSLRYTPPATGEHGGETIHYQVSDGMLTADGVIDVSAHVVSGQPPILLLAAANATGINPDLYTLNGAGMLTPHPLNPPNGSFGGEDGGFVQFGGYSYFYAVKPSIGSALHRMNAAGTVFLVDADHGDVFGNATGANAHFTVFAGALYFVGDTPSGGSGVVIRLEEDGDWTSFDLNPGHISFAGENGGFVELDGSLYFSAVTTTSGVDPVLIRLDQNNAVTEIPVRFAGEDGGFIAFNGALYFNGYSDTLFTDTLFRLDAGSTTPVEVGTGILTHQYGSPSAFHIFAGSLYFTEFCFGSDELFKLDSSGNLSELDYLGEALTGAGALGGWVDFAGATWFTATTSATGLDLFRLDDCGCVYAVDVIAGAGDAFDFNAVSGFAIFGNALYFNASTGPGTDGLYRLDAEGTLTQIDLGGGGTTLAGVEGGFRQAFGSLFFSAYTANGYELVRLETDGSYTAFDINPGPGGNSFIPGDDQHFGLLNGNMLGGTDRNDIIAGSAADEILDGGGGTDVLESRGGNDLMFGGDGADMFVLSLAGAANRVTIGDYSFAGADRIDLAALLDSGFGPGAVVASFARLRGVGDDLLLEVDLDGTTNGANWTAVAIFTHANTAAVDSVEVHFNGADYVLNEVDLQPPVFGAGTLTGSATELPDGDPNEGTQVDNAGGSIAFTDANIGDAHTSSYLAGGGGYIGTFGTSVTETVGSGTGSVDWTWTATDAELEGLRAGQIVSQTYTITVDDGDGGTDTEVVTITLTGANDAPTLNPPAAGLVTDTAADDTYADLTGTFTASDPDIGDTKSFSIVGGVASAEPGFQWEKSSTYGTLYLNAVTGAYKFVVNDNAVEGLVLDDQASFGITVTDGSAATDTKIYTINIDGTNDAPVITAPTTAATDEDTSFIFSGISVADRDIGGGDFLVTLSVSHGTLILTNFGNFSLGSGGSFAVSAANVASLLNGIRYTPDANYNGPDALTITINDQAVIGALQDTEVVNITVNAVNDPVTGNAPATLVLNEDTSAPIPGLSISDVDAVLAPGGLYQVQLSATHGTLTLATLTGLSFFVGDGTADATMLFRGTLADINAALATASYAANPDFFGPAQITMSVNDLIAGVNSTGSGPPTTDTDVINVTVNPVNDAPVNAVPGPVTVNEDTAIALTGITISDVDSAPSEPFTVLLTVQHGMLTIRTDVAGGITAANIVGGGNGTNGLTISATMQQINATLIAANGLIYQGDPNFNGNDSLRVSTWEGVPTDAASFGAPLSSAALANATSLVTGDLNGDGRLDLVYISNAANQIGVRFGNGDGTFGATTALAAGMTPSEVILADVDGDNDLDLVSTDYATGASSFGSIGVRLNNGSGVFGSYQVLASLQSPYDVVTGDVNGDGRLDIIVDRRDYGVVSVLLASGPLGSFAAPVNYNASIPNNTTGITLGDFNNDGRLDIVAFNQSLKVGGGNGTVSLLLNAGNGTFAAPVDIFSSGTVQPYEGTAYDLNNDGNLDLVFANYTLNDGVTVMLGNGNGTFAAPTFYATTGDADEVRVGDVNGDGIADIVTSNGASGSVAVFLGNGNGTFQPRVDLAIGSGYAETPTLGDFNGDGRLDIAVNGATNTGQRVLLNTGNNLGDTDTVAITVNPVNDAPAGTNGSATFNEDTTYTFSAADFGFTDPADGDAFLSVIVTTLPGAGTLTLAGNPVSAGQEIPVGQIGTLVFTPVANANGAGYANFTFQVRDNGGGANGGVDTDQSANTFTLNVNPVNDAPVIDLNGAAAGTGSIVTFTENGPDILLAPAATLVDIDSVDFDTGVLTVTITVNASLNDSLFAINQGNGAGQIGVSGPTISYGGVAIGTLAGGSAGSPLTVTFNANASQAAVQALVRQIGFAVNSENPTGGFRTIRFSLTDGDGGTSNNANANVTVLAVNDAPSGTDGAVTMTEDGTYVFARGDFGFSDPVEGHSFIAVTITTLPANGTLFRDADGPGGNAPVAVVAGDFILTSLIDAGGLTFVPAANGNGDGYASFTFQVVDSGGTTNGGLDTDQSPNTFTINVNAVNDAPVNSVPGAQNVNEDGSLVLSAAFGNRIQITDVDAGAGNVTVTLSVGHGILTVAVVANLSYVGNGTSSVIIAGTVAAINNALTTALTYDPDPNYNGPDTIQIVTSDNGNSGTGGTLTDSDSVAITVVSVNDAPAGTDNTRTGSEDDPVVFTAADFGLTDPNDVPANGLLAVKITTLPLVGTLFLDSDGAGVNPPVAVTAGQSISLADINAGHFYFLGATDGYGSPYASFTFQVQDNGGTANGGVDLDQSANTMTINLTPDNLPPAVDLNGAGPGIDYATSFVEDGTPVAIGSGIIVSDPDVGLGDLIESATITLTDKVAGDALSVLGSLPGGIGVNIVVNAGTIVLTLSGTASQAAYATAIGQIRYATTNQDPTVGGTDPARTITVTVNDGTISSAVATTTVTITPVDDLPVAQPDAFTFTESQVVTGASLFANNGSGADSDPDGPALAVSAVNGSAVNVGTQITLASGALLKVNANGTFDYNPNGAFLTTPTPGSGASNTPAHDSFTYTVAGGNTVTVSITLTGLDTDDVLLGTAGSDIMFAGVGSDTLTGGAGDDQLDGGAGTDTALFADSNLSFNSTVIGWVIGSSEGNDVLQRTEIAIDGTGQRHLLVGSTAFAGIQAAFDTANAGDIVRLANGSYSGTSIYADANLTVIAQPGAVLNTTFSTLGTDGITVYAAGGADTITTGAGNDVLYGGAGVDHLNGGGGNDSLNGGTSADVLTGGNGDDYYFVDDAGDQVVEIGGEGSDRVFAGVSYTLATGVSVEVMSTDFNAGTAAINLTGNELANTIFGNAGDNILNGGAGADTLLGLAGNDWYFVDNAGDAVFEAAGQGNDRVFAGVSYTLTAGAEVELLTTDFNAGTAAINLTGNELANTIFGNAGDNILNGGAGADTLLGLAGNDWYFVDNAGDAVFEAAGQGSDRVFASVSYTLGAGAEVEILSTDFHAGTGAINLTGNELANIVYGNDGDNVLNGGAGADMLVGRLGNDIFAFTTALGGGNVDAIADFQVGADKIALDDAVFTAIGGLGALNPNAFFAGTAAHDADDRIIYDQATGNLFYDADGNGAGAAVLFANLGTAPALTASDFIVI